MNDRIPARWERDFDIVIPPLVSYVHLGRRNGHAHKGCRTSDVARNRKLRGKRDELLTVAASRRKAEISSNE